MTEPWVVLAAQDDTLAAAWERAFAGVARVTVYRGSILDVPCDAVVSPANSFGLMQGGVDAVYMSRFGRLVEERLQERIRIRHHGELLVGTAEIVPTGDDVIPWLIAAPTMRVPMALDRSVNPYLAARAALLLVLKGRMPYGDHAGHPVSDHVKTLAFPGLGTGTGGVSPDVCAWQVRAALDGVRGGGAPMPGSHAEALEAHRRLCDSRQA